MLRREAGVRGTNRALVLNATFEPLGLVSTRRALLLVLATKAELVHATGRVFRSERTAFPEPSVVRLARYVRVPHDRTVAVNRRTVFARDSHRCQYCGQAAESIDHVLPRSRGGMHAWDNVVAACRRCNTRKEDRLPHEVGPGVAHPALGAAPARLASRHDGRHARRVGTVSGRTLAHCVTDLWAGAWSVEHARASARALHEAWPSPSAHAGRMVRLCTVVGSSAVVLGSAQDDGVLDAKAVRRAGLEVVRRGAGGGAVVVSPDAQVWADLWLPRGDPVWADDVVAASWWVGEVWARVLEGLGVGDPAVHRQGSIRAPWSAAVCFAGLGPGEVTVGGRKVVGLAQRRTRYGARFYAMAPLFWEPGPLLGVLGAEASEPDRDPTVLIDAATGLRDLVPDTSLLSDESMVAMVEEALVAVLSP